MPYYGEKQNIYQKLRIRRMRLTWIKQAYEILGNKCVNCGIDDYRVLQVDHIKTIRRKNNKSNADTGYRLRLKVIRGTTDLNNLQLLCANCHQIKTYKELYGHIE